MTRNLLRLLLGAILAVAVPVAVPRPAQAQSYSSVCPAMTDSITRLYAAYFGREPDSSGFNFWVDFYRSGQMSLEEISQAFAESTEFADRNLVSNQTYVNWLYNNLLDRQPNTNEVNHWVTALDGGYPRGSVMLTLTESSNFVQRTGTVPPLAGYLRWYPKGTHWYCNVGPSQETAVNPLVGQEVWGDYYFKNRGAEPEPVGLWTLDAERNLEAQMRARDTLSSGFTDYNWNGEFKGDGDYGRFIRVEAGPSTDWIVVFYPRTIGEDRIGWQLSS